MTPHRDKRGGTLLIDRTFPPPIGRLKKASGTNNVRTFNAMNDMLTALFETGRFDLLAAIRKGTHVPLAVYDAYRMNRLESLPSAETLVKLHEALPKWVMSYQCSEKHRASLKSSVKHIATAARADALVPELPAIVKSLRTSMRETPRAFNLVKHAAQAYVSDQMGYHHALWRELAGIRPLEEPETREAQTRSVIDLLKIRRKLNRSLAGAGDMAWTIAVTGMRAPSEYWGQHGQWSAKSDHVLIASAKQKHTHRRARHVPKLDVLPLVKPVCWYGKFRELLAAASDGQLQPYDLRRTYAHWLEEAGIRDTRIKLYLGHGKRTVTDRYLWHEVRPYLAKDARRLKRYLAREIRAFRKAHPKKSEQPLRLHNEETA